MAIGVYQIKVNDKKYIGSTIQGFSKRWNKHLRELRRGTHYNQYLQNAFIKYGEDALLFSIIETVETPEECIALEQHYIDALMPEYNICRIAGNKRGVKHTEETREKMSAVQLGNTYALGYKHSEGTREKMREVAFKRVMSDKTRQKLREINLGKIMSEEAKRKISEARKGKPAHNKGHMASEETRAKMSASRKGIRRQKKQTEEM